ncbi:MAG: tetratricopeptide repeat protein [Candidatus Wallbacteria bacterium]|nr:tetratricopeptide repeat protein [Candidatus Wallbacteria bacterium]
MVKTALLSVLCLVPVFFFTACGFGFEQGEAFFRERQFASAIQIFEQCLSAEVRATDSLYYLASCYLQLGQFSLSMMACNRFIEQPGKTEKQQALVPSIKDLHDQAAFSQAMHEARSSNLHSTEVTLSSLYSDYPFQYYLGIILREIGEYQASVDTLHAACNISGRREDSSFIASLRWELSRTFLKKFEKSQDLLDYFEYIQELRRAFLLEHPDLKAREKIALDYQKMIEDPLYIKHYAHLADAYHRIGRGFANSDTAEITDSAEFLILNSPLPADRIYACISLSKMHLYLGNDVHSALEYYKKGLAQLEGQQDAIPLRLMEGLGEAIRKRWDAINKPVSREVSIE